MHRVTERPWEALIIFLLCFFLFSVVLFIIDFVPEPIQEPETKATTTAPVTTVKEIPDLVPVQSTSLVAGPALAVVEVEASNLPTRIVIDKVGVDTPVVNPKSQSLAVLDAELLKGAVRYPGSAALGVEGSTVIFGHQSYLPVVRNQAFKAFNDLQDLKQGDTISVFAGSTEYRYTVRSVELVTTDVGSIALPTSGHTLTLVTCNSLGAKEERNIIIADFIGTVTH